MPQEVQHLPSKHKTLNSNPSNANKTKNTKNIDPRKWYGKAKGKSQRGALNLPQAQEGTGAEVQLWAAVLCCT
jgi:hypothetical protein